MADISIYAHTQLLNLNFSAHFQKNGMYTFSAFDGAIQYLFT